MKYYSTKNPSKKSGFRQAVIQGLPTDNGLYMPEYIPLLPKTFFGSLTDISLQEIGYEVLSHFVGDEIPASELQNIIDKTLSFDIPLIEIKENIYALELFHGPSYAFKDVGAKFLAQCLDYFYRDADKKCTILVATSGDTGGAVAAAFSQTKNIEVVILYPSGKVSDLQEKQLTTYEKNVTALEISGDFDDCQRLVKSAFLDNELRDKIQISSANSINIARFIPQSIYYYIPFKVLGAQQTVSFSVPSGNYGNLTAGLIAQRMGLPVSNFIASSNRNDAVPRYLFSGTYEPKPTIATISNAMDVGSPSNFQRMLNLFDNDHKKMIEVIKGYSFTDEETLEIMHQVYQQYNYLLDPHGAVAYGGIEKYLQQSSLGEIGIILETAHPCKFMDTVKQISKENIMPDTAHEFLSKEKKSIKMEPDYDAFRAFLLES
ncbi:threonine synthase [Marivirga sp. S37H4]|uniref:Threonine synthase n=1 Tax=Marivirga aurantiaca TaxID=2802615 RepID=A0A934X0Z2_9BACT|nr:threonine synthase [Marivirga aurantiaca]MBK6266481.1 threonine synthase [Marivirga aurantiaca]